ncbi:MULTISPECIES: calcium/sodium antiporter [Cycloclasticus]|uniref:K+-dependent Na+/Ca+ exchanger-like protein n=1 Tax=Cycloclasticus pugetii TaxID=34068 RepID=A0AB33Z3K5_9GAMM|nr:MULTISPECIES: calcium/sodium antiporter [Cycloclasticus]ATI02782.1 calcium/sodium antiporter [Cycloclasticus sp. PY97N]EPD13526.1 K+-dependent Na+/Ca+ exchanger-like protein [Cycloclasticus pugetii]
MLVFSVALLAGFFFLIFSADYFVKGTSAIARNIGISPLIIGLTIIGLGTSAPEMLVAGIASVQGNTGLATGNAVGSNIANIGLVLGVTALISPILIKSSLLKRELPILLVISIISYLLLVDGHLSRFDGLILFAGLIAFLYWLLRSAQQNKQQKKDILAAEFDDEIPSDLSTKTASFYVIIGLTILIISSKLLVWAAVNIAILFGVSDLVIGLTIIAIGTSLPELAASIMSVIKKEPDLAVGNIIGSNAFNLLAVLCLPGLLHPGNVDPQLVSRDLPIMLGFTLCLFIFSYSFNGQPKINRFKGGVFMLFFVAYLSKVYLDTLGI